MNVRRFLLFLFCCFLAALPSPATADDASAPSTVPGGSLNLVDENAENQTWKLTADKLTSLNDGSVLEAEGNVYMQRGLEYLKADYARYYPSTNWVYLRGAVDVRLGKDVIMADSAEFDLRSRTGWLTNGNIFMEGPHMYFSGGRIVKHRGDRYTFNEAKITACDGEVPSWSVTAEEATVEIDGYARLYRSSFQVKDTSVLAMPFMIVPAKTTRQSGFLMPDYGVSSKRGLYYTQPYFQVIDESRDMTFYATMMEKMGPMGSIQYRSHTTEQDKTWLMGSVLASKNIVRENALYDDDSSSNSDLARTNWTRYWLRGMADGHVGASAWRYRVNLDLVSDQDYLTQFGSGPIGFDASRNETFGMFGRDFREDDQKRMNAGILYRDWERVSVALSTRYEQDARLGNGNRPRSEDETVQHLPALEAFLHKGRILPELPLEGEMQASTAYMYRRSGTRGGRSELYPRVSLPWDLKYGSIIATGGWRNTFYNTRTQANTDYLSPYTSSPDAPHQTKDYRSMLDLDIQAYTEAQRIWTLTPDEILSPDSQSVGKSVWTGLRHQIQPRLRYQTVPNEDQQHNPFYMQDDRIRAKNELTYSITNVLTRKTSTVVKVPGKPGDAPDYVTQDAYQDILWWKVQAGYDFEEAERTQYRDSYDRRPWMDVYSELEVSPLSWLSYTNKTYLSPHDGEISRTDNSLNLKPWNWISATTGFSYRTSDYELRQLLQYDDERDVTLESPLRLLRNKLDLNWDNTWGLSLEEYRDLEKHEVYDRTVKLSYTDQCYRFTAAYRMDDRDESFTLYVELPGLFE